MKPFLSVLVCTYNYGRFIDAALKSIAEQTMPKDKFEVIVVDDGSTDGSAGIIRPYASIFNLIIHSNKNNRGLPYSCNQGLALVKGKYFLRLDADDRLRPCALQEFYAAACNQDADFVYSDRYEVELASGKKKLIKCSPFNLYDLIAVGVLLRSSIARQIGGFRDMFWEEYDFFIRFLDVSKKTPCYIAKPLIEYYRHLGSMTTNEENMQNGWWKLFEILGVEEIRKYGFCPALENILKKEGKK